MGKGWESKELTDGIEAKNMTFDSLRKGLTFDSISLYIYMIYIIYQRKERKT